MEYAPGVHHARLFGVDTFIIAERGQPLTLIDAGMFWSRRPIEGMQLRVGRRVFSLPTLDARDLAGHELKSRL